MAPVRNPWKLWIMATVQNQNTGTGIIIKVRLLGSQNIQKKTPASLMMLSSAVQLRRESTKSHIQNNPWSVEKKEAEIGSRRSILFPCSDVAILFDSLNIFPADSHNPLTLFAAFINFLGFLKRLLRPGGSPPRRPTSTAQAHETVSSVVGWARRTPCVRFLSFQCGGCGVFGCCSYLLDVLFAGSLHWPV